MRELFKMTGSLLIIALLIAHFFLIAFFVAPSNKLLGLLLSNDTGFLSAENVPAAVETFLVDHHVTVDGDYHLDDSSRGKIILSVLEMRRNYMMEPIQQIALDANLLNYGEGLIGIRAASEYYYKKDLAELSESQWITLVNLHKIFSKK